MGANRLSPPIPCREHEEQPPYQVHIDTADNISVTIEVKFLLPALPLHAHDLHRTDGRGVLRVSSPGDTASLQRQGYAAIADTINQVPGQRATTTHQIADSARLTGHLSESDFWDTHWVVKRANSAEPTQDDPRYAAYLWVPVEISSPKLHWCDPSGFGSPSKDVGDRRRDKRTGILAGAEEPQLWPAVGKVLHGIQRNHRVVTNHTCDVHVHVGRIDGRPFSLPTLKRLATMLWLAESRLHSIRDPFSLNYNNTYTWGAEQRRYSRLAKALESKEDLAQYCSGTDDMFTLMASALNSSGIESGEQFQAIRAIWMTASHQELGRLLSGDTKQYWRLGFNFSGFGEEDERARNGPKTIEFQHLEGTLDSDLVLGWMHICCTLLEVAVEEPSLLL